MISDLISRGALRPEFDANYLLSEILSIPQTTIRLESKKTVAPDAAKRLVDAAERRARGEPLQYIVGRAYFRNLSLDVGSGVLIPRPETESIVDIVLEDLPAGSRVCDAGTGSGAVAIAVATERPDAHVVGVDIQNDALRFAERNRRKVGAENLSFVQADLLEPFHSSRFDALVANLPYVRLSDFQTLPTEIRFHEPASALIAGHDGLDVLRRLIKQAPTQLRGRGSLVVEIDPRQVDAIVGFLRRSGQFGGIQKKMDLNGLVRFVKAIKR